MQADLPQTPGVPLLVGPGAAGLLVYNDVTEVVIVATSMAGEQGSIYNLALFECSEAGTCTY